MKTKIFRIVTSLILIYMAYGETGIYTAGTLFLMLISTEGQAFINEQTIDTFGNHKKHINDIESHLQNPADNIGEIEL